MSTVRYIVSAGDDRARWLRDAAEPGAVAEEVCFRLCETVTVVESNAETGLAILQWPETFVTIGERSYDKACRVPGTWHHAIDEPKDWMIFADRLREERMQVAKVAADEAARRAAALEAQQE